MFPDGYLRKDLKDKVEDTCKKEEKNFTLKQSKKTRAFWMFGLALSFSSFFITGFTFHVVSIFESVNYSKTEAVSIFLPISIIAISVSTVANILSDYIAHKIYLYVMITSGFLVSYGILTLNTTSGFYFLLIGLGVYTGLFSVVNAVTWPRYYGRKFLGAISGKIMSFLVIASAIAPSLFSYCYTTFGSYTYISYLLLPFLLFLFIGSLKVKKP